MKELIDSTRLLIQGMLKELKRTNPSSDIISVAEKHLKDFPHIRYAITCIKKDGLRAMIGACQGRNTYVTLEQARQALKDTLENNLPDNLISIFGPQSIGTFKVSPVECWSPDGDPKGPFTDEVIEVYPDIPWYGEVIKGK
jgi:hypothetical protein